jgi:hypothetical protein
MLDGAGGSGLAAIKPGALALLQSIAHLKLGPLCGEECIACDVFRSSRREELQVVPFRGRRVQISFTSIDTQESSAHCGGASWKRVRQRILKALCSPFIVATYVLVQLTARHETKSRAIGKPALAAALRPWTSNWSGEISQQNQAQ